MDLRFELVCFIQVCVWCMSIFNLSFVDNVQDRVLISMRLQATRKRSSSSGMALMLVLVIVSLLALLVYYAQVSAQVWNVQAARELEHSRLKVAARETAWLAMAKLAADVDVLSDHTNEVWAETTEILYPDGVCAKARIEDEERRINLNNMAVVMSDGVARSSFQIVSDLLGRQGRINPNADAGLLRRRLETQAVSNLNVHESLAELTDLLCSGTNDCRRMADVFTALPVTPVRVTPINVNTALPDALYAVLGPGREAVMNLLLDLRRTYPLASLAPLETALGTRVFSDTKNHFAVRSRYFSVFASAWRADKTEEVYALAERDDQGAVRILRWVER